MALDTALITGNFQCADGTVGSDPQLIFRLSTYDTQPGIAVARTDRVADLGAEGELPDTFSLAKNTAMLRASYYDVYYSETTVVGGAKRRRPPEFVARIQIGDEDSYTITELLDNPVPEAASWNINILREQFWRARGSVNPLDFGAATGDDDTSLVASAHALANSLNVPVTLAGIKDLYVQADAQFAAYTSLDGAGCTVHFVDGIVTVAGGTGDEDLDDDELGFADALSCWIFSDPLTPLLEDIVDKGVADGQIAEAALKLRSQYPTLGVWDGPGYAKIESGGSVVAANRRGAAGTMNYRQAFSLSEHGKALIGLHADLSADTAVALWRRANSARGHLRITNLNLDITDTNALKALVVQRNGCTVAGLTVIGTTATFSRHNLVRYDDVCDQVLRDIHGRAFLNTPNKASRLINSVGGANFLFDNVNGYDGWGIVGTQQTQGMTYVNCDLNRADIHQWGGDLLAIGCGFEGYGITYGVATGFIKAEACHFNNTKALIAKRKDWAGETFDATFTIDGAEIRDTEGDTTVIDLASWPAGSTEAPCRLPDIRVRGIERLSKMEGLGAVTTTDVVNIKVDEDSLEVYAPAAIVIDDVTVPPLGRIQALAWPAADLEPCGAGAATQVTLSQLRARNIASTSSAAGSTIYSRPSEKTATGAAAEYRVSDSTGLSIEAPDDVAATTYRLAVCDVARLNVGDSRNVHQAGCDYITPLIISPETKAPVAGVAGAGTAQNFTAIEGGRVGSSNFDFSEALAISGLLVRAHSPTLPCTKAEAWAGWTVAGFAP
jgi:hypothetical protein